MSRARLITSCVLAALGAIVILTTGASRHPQQQAPASATDQPDIDYEARFFHALNIDAAQRDSALAILRRRVAEAPRDGRAMLLLGVCHLWIAAENPPAPEVVTEHLILAAHYLEQAAALLPADDRIPTWLYSAAYAAAEAEGRDEDAAAALDRLRGIATADPCFHSVAFAIAVWEGTSDRPEFREAIGYLERASRCGAEDPSVRNMPRWPHNVHGFMVALADVYLKSGDVPRAEASLVIAESWDGFERWPHRKEVEDRFAQLNERAERFADDDLSNDPPFIFARGGAVSCLSCHQGSAPEGP